MGNNLQCSTGCCDRTTELQPDNVAHGDFAIKEGGSNSNSKSIMKPKKAPKFEVQDIVASTEGVGNGGSSSNKNRNQNVVVANQSDERLNEEKKSNPLNGGGIRGSSTTGVGAIVMGAGGASQSNQAKSNQLINDKKKSITEQVDGGNSQRSSKSRKNGGSMAQSKTNINQGESSVSKQKAANESAQEKNSRADILKQFQFGGIVVEESSFRMDQRMAPLEEKKNGQTSAVTSTADMLKKKIERGIYERYMHEAQLAKKLIINPRMMVSHRKNPIEVTYEVLEVIGKGGYGEVKKVKHKELDVIRALKVIKKSRYKSPQELKMIKNEINIMKVVDHPNIVKLYEFFEDDENFYIIQEFCSGGQLFEAILKKKTFSENEAADIMTQLLSAIAHCHQRKIVHRDVKPENLLIDKMDHVDQEKLIVKVIDFGISTHITPDQKLTLSIGTPYYVAPEVIEGQYNEKCDVWSCGVILYILLCGYPPFYGRDANSIYNKILKGEFSFNSKEWSSVSKAAKDLIKKMLQKLPANRVSASEALSDAWIKSFQRGGTKEFNGQNGKRSRSSSPTTVKPLCASALTSLKNFHCERKLQQAVLAYIANSMNTKTNEDKLLAIFKQFDQDHDGILTANEIKEGFKEFLGDQMLFEGELDKIMEQVDLNRNGQIEYSEFVAAASNFYQMLTEKHLKQAFDLFDLDANGQITPRELKHVLGNKNKEIPDEDWEKLVEEFDRNGDGMINFEEFKQMMLSLHTPQQLEEIRTSK